MLAFDGVWSFENEADQAEPPNTDGNASDGNAKGDNEVLRFHAMPGPDKWQLAQVAWNTCQDTTKLLREMGVYEDESYSLTDLSVVDEPLLAESLAASISNAVAVGPRAGQRVAHMGQLFSREPYQSQKMSEVTGPHHGYNLHASTRVSADDRKGLARLCRYILSPGICNERLSYVAGDTKVGTGEVVYRLKA